MPKETKNKAQEQIDEVLEPTNLSEESQVTSEVKEDVQNEVEEEEVRSWNVSTPK